MATVTGKVEAKSNKFGKFAILVNDTWYSSKFEIKAERGDEVEFDDGGSKWCQKLKVTSGGGGATTSSGGRSSGGGSFRGSFPVPATDGTRSIVRQNSLTNATALINTSLGAMDPKLPQDKVEAAMEIRAKLILDVASLFEAYSTGDSDLAEAQAAVKDAA